ncbi:formylglycine-generating enzyme family protein [Paraflavitalea pollutisoli]|uniref:formylglycine-generating enzyme family protein n=1 Tax=Paraflavitalea pollutisoli TaxID=3034143 RepID=UPI0023EDDEC3|nr:SUMF1/EgtB/PvdO family nonheme iron enzyme [Paraflavitalea sp. H1-2-19X]
MWLLLLYAWSGQAQSSVAAPYVVIPGGLYIVGKKGHGINPYRTVKLSAFRIARKETTNTEFAAFVKATGYITDAERRHDALVYRPGLAEFEWHNDSTANWRYPNGITYGSIDHKMDHPVTCISYQDILAYCRWAGVRLPSLDEWEVACRACTTTDFSFGKDTSLLRQYANTWHRTDHLVPDSSDGYLFTSPVGSFAANPWGLYDMYGNVFEFCSGKTKLNHKPTVVHARGGSWWCSPFSCHFFNSYDIGSVYHRASFSNQGFRVVYPAGHNRAPR